MHCEGGKRTQSGIQNACRGELAPCRALRLHGLRDRRPRRGFALIVVLALLSLLVLMVLTLTTQLQLSLLAAKQSIRQEQARLNARFALDVALAQLQRQAGPDQRVTARADVMINSQQQPGLASDSAQIFWTGVWKSYRPGAPNQELDQGFNERNQLGANLRGWSLDSNTGNAGVDRLDAGGPQWLVSWPASSGAKAALNPRFGPSPNPTDPDVETATDSSLAFKTLARVVDATTGKLHHVRAWKVPMPGLPAVEGEGTLPGGAYAYWVSDEGVKAKANLVSPWPLTEGNYAENQLNFLTPQRMAVEKMLIDPLAVNAISAQKLAVPRPTEPTHLNLARVHSLGDLANLLPQGAIKPDGKLSGSPGAGYTLSQRFFPDITTWSYGVLSDARRGGLKYDLTAAFEDVSQYQTLLERTRNVHDDLANDEKVYRVAPGSMPSASAGASSFRMDGLRWHTLYFYYNLYKPQLPNPFSGVGASPFAGPQAGPAANPSMRMRFYTYPTAVREFALMPRMVMTQIYYGLSYDGSSKLRFHLYPAIVLYNPYNVTLNAPAGVKFHVNTNARLSIQVRRPVTGNNTNVGYVEMPNEGTGTYDYAPSVLVRERRFMLSTSINANYNLEPGELRVYALPSEFQRGEQDRLGIVQDLSDRVTHAGNSIYRNVVNVNGSTVSPLNYSSNDTLVIDDSDIITSDQTGSFEVSTSQTSQFYWPMNSPNPRQEMARLMFRAFDTQVNVPGTPIMTYQGSNALKLGGLGFHVKPVNPRPVIIDQNLGGVNFAPAPWPALPVFASVLPAANLFSNFYEGPMVDHVSEIVPNGPNTDRLSLGAINESGADGNSYLRARWGLTGNSAGGQTHVVLRDVPRQPLASLGQFMHVNANYWVSAVPIVENTPGVETYIKFNGGFSSPTYDNVVMHPVGGSLAPAMMRGTPASLGVAMPPSGGTVDTVMARRKKFENRIEALPEFNSGGSGGGGGSGGNLSILTSVLNENNRNVWFRDDNFLANETLFDGYFFSTVPALARNVSALPPVGKVFNSAYVTAGQPLPNSRMAYYFPGGSAPSTASLQNADRAAANLLLDGAFNINSTSVDAWVALLSSMSGYDLRIWNANAGAKAAQTLSATSELRNLSPILRFTSPVATRSASKILTINQPFEGICALKDDEVRDLAIKIVEQIKARGPFLSLGDFLNRRLSNKTASADNNPDLTKNFTLMGALQAAIDNNSTIIQRLRNSPLTTRAADKATIDNWQNSNGDTPVMHWFQNRFMYMQQMPIMTRSLPAYNVGGNPSKTFSAQGIPGWLMQQDLVQAFSSVMIARSDTFIIRTYGESADPLTGEITARAWLEAVVQRYPDFMDPAVPAETRSRYINDQRIKANALSDLTEPGGPAFNPLIREFGRKFRIVSIRWLNENEI